MGLWDYVPAGALGAVGLLDNVTGGHLKKKAQDAYNGFQNATNRDQHGYGGKLGDVAEEGRQFGRESQDRFRGLAGQLSNQRAQLQKIADGTESVSRMQLGQALQQNQAQQQSMAARARPGNAAMAARTAAMTAGRQAAGLAGQQAIAGIQERQAAQDALSRMLLQERQQELQAAGLGQQGALGGYGAAYTGAMQTPTGLEKVMGLAKDGLTAYATGGMG